MAPDIMVKGDPSSDRGEGQVAGVEGSGRLKFFKKAVQGKSFNRLKKRWRYRAQTAKFNTIDCAKMAHLCDRIIGCQRPQEVPIIAPDTLHILSEFVRLLARAVCKALCAIVLIICQRWERKKANG